MRILGIDPGTSLIGYGIIEAGNGKVSCVSKGCVVTPKNIPNADRMVKIFNFFSDLVKKEKIDLAAIEKIFFFKNAKTVVEVSEIRGIVILALKLKNIEIREFTPLEVKQAVSSYGRASKQQVQQMIKMILSLEEMPKPDDIADALAIAICCANTVRFS